MRVVVRKVQTRLRLDETKFRAHKHTVLRIKESSRRVKCDLANVLYRRARFTVNPFKLNEVCMSKRGRKNFRSARVHVAPSTYTESWLGHLSTALSCRRLEAGSTLPVVFSTTLWDRGRLRCCCCCGWYSLSTSEKRWISFTSRSKAYDVIQNPDWFRYKVKTALIRVLLLKANLQKALRTKENHKLNGISN